MEGFDLQQILGGTTLEECALECLQQGHACVSFEHNTQTGPAFLCHETDCAAHSSLSPYCSAGACNLNHRAASPTLPLTVAAGWAYHARIIINSDALLQGGAFIRFDFSGLLLRSNTVNITFRTLAADGLLWRQGQYTSGAGSKQEKEEEKEEKFKEKRGERRGKYLKFYSFFPFSSLV